MSRVAAHGYDLFVVATGVATESGDEIRWWLYDVNARLAGTFLNVYGLAQDVQELLNAQGARQGLSAGQAAEC
jgi:hypothetical protein